MFDRDSMELASLTSACSAVGRTDGTRAYTIATAKLEQKKKDQGTMPHLCGPNHPQIPSPTSSQTMSGNHPSRNRDSRCSCQVWVDFLVASWKPGSGGMGHHKWLSQTMMRGVEGTRSTWNLTGAPWVRVQVFVPDVITKLARWFQPFSIYRLVYGSSPATGSQSRGRTGKFTKTKTSMQSTAIWFVLFVIFFSHFQTMFFLYNSTTNGNIHVNQDGQYVTLIPTLQSMENSSVLSEKNVGINTVNKVVRNFSGSLAHWTYKSSSK